MAKNNNRNFESARESILVELDELAEKKESLETELNMLDRLKKRLGIMTTRSPKRVAAKKGGKKKAKVVKSVPGKKKVRHLLKSFVVPKKFEKKLPWKQKIGVVLHKAGGKTTAEICQAISKLEPNTAIVKIKNGVSPSLSVLKSSGFIIAKASDKPGQDRYSLVEEV